MQERVPAIALLSVLLAWPLSGRPSDPEREGERGSRKDEIGKPLSELAAGRLEPRTLRIQVEWHEGGNSTSARLFGNGAGIWNDRVAFRLSRSDVLSIARALTTAGFGAMPNQIGEEGDLPRLRGKIVVSIAGETREVVQLVSEEESKPLSALASRILDLSRKRAKTGVTASSLLDALEKLSSGALAPEALRLTAQRSPERPDSAERGWLLQLEGCQALARPYAPRSGYGSQKRFELSGPDFRSLIGVVRDSDPAGLPSSLFASDYTEVRIEALQWSRDLLARRSLNVTRQTHGDRQKAFDRVVESLRALEERVEREGREDAGR